MCAHALATQSCAFFARRLPEIRCRAAHVVDVPLEFRIARKLSFFNERRLPASRRHDVSLMERERTEAVFVKASGRLLDRLNFTSLIAGTARSLHRGDSRASYGKAYTASSSLGGKRLLRRVLCTTNTLCGYSSPNAFRDRGRSFPLHIEAARIRAYRPGAPRNAAPMTSLHAFS